MLSHPAAAPAISAAEPYPQQIFQHRHPRVVQQVLDSVPYGAGPKSALNALLAESKTGAMAQPHGLWDVQQWWEWDQGYFGQPWAQAPFLWAESWFYRRLLAAVGYCRSGPWQGIDPFGALKVAELGGLGLTRQLEALEQLAGLSETQRGSALLRAALAGNQADLGFKADRIQTSTPQAELSLLVDDSTQFWQLLATGSPGTVVLVADNSGPELIPDLILLEFLLATGRAEQVVLHVKPAPYYVSDATTADVLAAVSRLCAAGPQAAAIGGRLLRDLRAGRLSIHTDAFWCAPMDFTHLPAGLHRELGGAALTIIKGDLNYRRLVQDRHWPVDTAFADLLHYFPAPVAALRLIKSEVVVGVASATVAGLAAKNPHWRTSGTCAVLQCSGPGEVEQNNEQ